MDIRMKRGDKTGKKISPLLADVTVSVYILQADD
ncbi:hypothetical protein N643_12215 [Salmonella bongori serovar 48:z41:-- str. RKS3044]|nr:hypothetical protein N643_12215 [Salmonella bongori serovar 48:z41:-- str. RKS3044]